MAVEALSLERLSITLGSLQILHDITLDVPAGSFTCLLGPSGCGKTTLLRAIAGFAPPSAGDIRIGDRSITALPPEKRGTAMVFQSYALWPHMNVLGNLTYPLKLRGIAKADRENRARQILQMLELDRYADRKVSDLSGGQRQRVALGRALVIDPPILLLDEPLSNLDAAIRRNLRSELRQLQQRLGITTIMVTHDQEEALAMADRIVLMRGGEVIQVAPPEELYTRPVDLAAARFLGVDNVLAARGGDPVQAAAIGFRTADARVIPLTAAADDAAMLTRQGVVIDSAYTGGGYHIRLMSDKDSVTALSSQPFAPQTPVRLQVPAAAVMGFDAQERLTAKMP